jgi:hypothetical protein
MTPYVLVEGEQTERRILKPWFEYLYPGLSWVEHPDQVTTGSGFLLAAHGYPSILDNIKGACQDIEQFTSFDVFIIVCDAEEEDWAVHRQKFVDLVSQVSLRCPCIVAVPNCCIETWLLGNQKFMPRVPSETKLKDFAAIYNVRDHDPEALPAIVPHRNRADTHLEYLRAIFDDQGFRRFYRKNWVGPVAEEHYLRALIHRVSSTGHLKSFEQFLRDLNQVFPISQDTPTPAAPPPSPA